MAAEALLPEFDHEMTMTRRLLERVPDAVLSWRPHEKSFTMAGLATHLANIPRWGRSILDHTHYDLAQSEGRRPPEGGSCAEILAAFDQHVGAVRKTLIEKSDAELGAIWTLKRGDHVVLTMPRTAAIRRFLVHHMIHHRGQLSVYLRLQNVALPPMYGPSADERL
ncbi:MAG TPA: DinB family protein [Vicinamibacterales bacterium]|nr:DinB family protein [Vicinamibacterales bacterium]